MLWKIDPYFTHTNAFQKTFQENNNKNSYNQKEISLFYL